MAATEIVAVLDAGPLIHLDELGWLILLNDFKELLVPQAVLDEALKHRPGLRLAELSIIEIISEPPPLPAELQKLADELALHAGERAALAVLKARGVVQHFDPPHALRQFGGGRGDDEAEQDG